MTCKRMGKGIAALLVVVAIVFVCFKALGYVEQMKMVNSEEAKEVYEKDLKYIDKDAFTQQGVIQSYQISSFEKNPMGGIIVYLFVNDYKEYTVSVFLHKNDSDGKLVSGGGSWAPQLEQLIKEKNQ